MKSEVILSGIGGQGIVLMGECLGRAAMKMGYKVTIAPSYGQEKRGSYVHCQIAMGDALYSPAISKADALFAMDDASLNLYEKNIKAGGALLLNADNVTREPKRADIFVLRLPLSSLALEAGSGKSANMVGLGALVKATTFLPLKAVQEVMGVILKPSILDVNLKALEIGYYFN